MTVNALIDQVLSLAYPRRFGRDLRSLKNHLVLHGLTNLQARVPGFQSSNTTQTPGGSEGMDNGATVFTSPDGEIQEVVLGEPEGRRRMAPANYIPPAKMQQFRADFATAFGYRTSVEEIFYPPHAIMWTVDDGQFLVYPWVPSTWTVGIRWRGIRRDWNGNADVWWGDKAIEALRRYVLAMSALDEGCRPKSSDLYELYIDEAANLANEDRKKRFPNPPATYLTDSLGFGLNCSTDGTESEAVAGCSSCG